MGAFSFWHVVVVLLVVLIIFGAGKLPKVMGDLGRGMKNFKESMKTGEEENADATARQVPPPAANATAAQPAADETKKV
jgi:sec-independent protein translocase protein TatA